MNRHEIENATATGDVESSAARTSPPLKGRVLTSAGPCSRRSPLRGRSRLPATSEATIAPDGAGLSVVARLLAVAVTRLAEERNG